MLSIKRIKKTGIFNRIAALPVGSGAPTYGGKQFSSGGNCYSYALDRPQSDGLHPGQLSGTADDYNHFASYRIFSAPTHKSYHEDFMPSLEEMVRKGAKRDGLIEVVGDPALLVIPKDHYLVSLAMGCCTDGHHDIRAERMPDYHWVRQDVSGLFSQRNGARGPITDLDASGDLIFDPRIMNRGDYDKFSGFFLAHPQVGRG
jgi:hypothetical protein